MAKEMYRVTVEVECYVVADSADEAKKVVEFEAVPKEMHNARIRAHAIDLVMVPAKIRGSLPWGTTDDLTIVEWFAAQEAIAKSMPAKDLSSP